MRVVAPVRIDPCHSIISSRSLCKIGPSNCNEFNPFTSPNHYTGYHYLKFHISSRSVGFSRITFKQRPTRRQRLHEAYLELRIVYIITIFNDHARVYTGESHAARGRRCTDLDFWTSKKACVTTLARSEE